ncbi:MAG: four helix bundle protein [Treponema sp.]|jgi:four helix bundle protein|nr:four helix bundle protein [Treponema sp.]
MKENVIREKSMAFAIRIVNLYRVLCDRKKEYVLSKQVLRAGTSIGANMAEAECAISRKDFLAKAYIAYKECSETKYWLELLQKTDFISMAEFSSIAGDCAELYRILAAITKTTRDNEE